MVADSHKVFNKIYLFAVNSGIVFSKSCS